MKQLLRLCAVVMVVVCATWAYRVNYATQEALNRVADLEDAIAAEHEALAVLDAEWAYLNRPDRLRALVAENAATFGLAELTPDQFGEVAMIAYPPEPDPELVAETGGPAGTEVVEAASPPKPPAKVAAAKPDAPKVAAKPAARREAVATRPAAPRSQTVAARPRLPVTLQDLVNAVAGARP